MRTRHALITGLALTTCAGSATGLEFLATWLGSGGNWQNPLNWTTALGPMVPNNGVDTWAVQIPGGALCNLDGSPTINRIGMLQGDVLDQANNTTFSIVSDPTSGGNPSLGVFLMADSTYLMSSTGNNTNLVATGGPGTLRLRGADPNDQGQVTMSDTTSNRIYAGTGAETIVFGPNLTLEGAGQIGLNQSTLHNESAVIRATQNQPMIIDPGTGGCINDSFMLADGVGTLQINGGFFDNLNGIIAGVGPSSRVRLSGGTIDSGMVQSGNGTFELNGGAIQNATLNITAFGEVTANTSVEDIINDGVITHFNNVNGLRWVGTFTNRGLYMQNSTGNNADVVIRGDSLLTGGGEVSMSDATGNRWYGEASTYRLNNQNNWIHGSGQIGLNQMVLTNTGVIEADIDGSTLTVDTAGGVSINWGTFRASNGGILVVNADTFDQEFGGRVEAMDGSRVELSNPVMFEGTYDTDGTGVVRITGNSTTLDGASNEGTIELLNNVNGLHVLNSMFNTGTINLLSTGNNTSIIIDSSFSLTGGGVIDMSGMTGNRVLASSGSYTFTNHDNTIRGGGQIGLNQTIIDNRGVISADEAGASLTVDPVASGSANSGLMEAVIGGELRLGGGNFDNSGGQIIARDLSTVRLDSSSVIDNGTITGEAGSLLQFNGGRVRLTAPTISAAASGLISGTNGGCENGLNNHGVLDFLNNVNFNIGGDFNNTGLVTMSSIGNNSDFILSSDAMLTGGGEVAMSSVTSNRWRGDVVSRRLTNVDNWIHGSGQIGTNQMQLTNQGVIEADAGGTLTIDCAGGASVNSGVFRASGGGLLIIQPETFDQTGGGLIEALDGSRVELSSAAFVGGTFDTDGSGVVRITGSSTSLTDCRNDGLIEVPNNLSGLRLYSAFENNGTVQTLSIGNNTSVICENDVLITGTGEIVLGGMTGDRLYCANSSITMTNASTIRGGGSLGLNQSAIVNLGNIIADDTSGSLVIDTAGAGLDNQGGGLIEAAGPNPLMILAGPMTTSGTLRANAGRTLSRTGDVQMTGGLTDSSGRIECTGVFSQSGGDTVVDGSLSCSSFVLDGGTLSGSGLVQGSTTNNGGALNPGGSAEALVDDLSIVGDYVQGAAGSMGIRLISSSSNTALFTSGFVTLDGTLVVTADGGFTPSAGQSFTIVTSLGVSGAFGSIDATGLPNGLGVDVSYDKASVTITLTACRPDMAPPFGTLDFFDVLQFLNDFDAMNAVADFAAPFGTFDFFDVLQFLQEFDAGCP